MNRNDLTKMIFFVRSLDIGINPEPAAIFDPLIQGFNVWAIPSDHPGGDQWEEVLKDSVAAAYTKRCEYVGCAFVVWRDDLKTVDYINISSDAYGFQDKWPREFNYRNIHNRPNDIAWVKSKALWVFEQIGVECPEIRVGEDK